MEVKRPRLIGSNMNDEFEQRLDYPVDGVLTPMVMIPEDRYERLLRVSGQAKRRAVEHKLDDYIRQNIHKDSGSHTHAVTLEFDPIRIVASRRTSSELFSALMISDPDGTIIRQVRREVKRLLYDTVMQDVAEHPEDYRV